MSNHNFYDQIMSITNTYNSPRNNKSWSNNRKDIIFNKIRRTLSITLPSPSYNNHSLLIKTVISGDIQNVYYLLNFKRINPNIKSLSKTPLLIHALLEGTENLGIIYLLLKFGADVNSVTSDGLTPLMIAAIKGHTEIVKHLLKINANKNARYVFGYTALDFAKNSNHIKIYKLLNKK